jgi:hypothetical protein
MRKGSILLSPQHGVNPSVGVCFYCGEDDGTVVLAGKMKGDAEAPHKAIWTKEPCPKCKDYMKQGIIFIGVRDGEASLSPGENPYRSGQFLVVKEEAVKRMLEEKSPALLADILKQRVAFLEESTLRAIGAI